MERVLHLVVQFFANDAVFEPNGTGPRHRRNEAVLLQDRPVVRRNQIETVAAQPRHFAAHVFERHHRIEVRSHRRLLDAAFARNLLNSGLCLRDNGARQRG